MMRKNLTSSFCLCLLLCLSLSLNLRAQVLINEFQASNAATIADPQNGESPGEVLGVSRTSSVENDLKLTIYPNPVSNELHVIGDLEGDEIYQLIGADGKLMQAGKLVETINVNMIPEGFYILRVENKMGVGSLNVVVSR